MCANPSAAKGPRGPDSAGSSLWPAESPMTATPGQKRKARRQGATTAPQAPSLQRGSERMQTQFARGSEWMQTQFASVCREGEDGGEIVFFAGV